MKSDNLSLIKNVFTYVYFQFYILSFSADLYVEKMRFKAVSCMSRSYRPTVPVSYIARVLGFTTMLLANEDSEDKDLYGIEECVEWLKAHGACLITDNNGEMQLDTKVCSTLPLYFTYVLLPAF